MRPVISTLTALAVAAALPLVVAPAQAGPAPTGPERLTAGDPAGPPARSDDRSHPLDIRRSTLRQRAVEELLSGAARLQGRGQSRTIQMSDGVEVDYPVSQHADLLTFLVEFGGAGPRHNQIPEPGPPDNTTYWKADFDRQHYRDMFFNGMPEQGGESFQDLYREMSSGRFELSGDVSDWVTVPQGEASYGVNVDEYGESNANMTRLISDTAAAWMAGQLVTKTEAQVRDELARYDRWDRYDGDRDGDYQEPDGYIDHFQVVHAGVGEEAGGPDWSIWSHRWAANLAQSGLVGPTGCAACAPLGGVEIGDTGYWIFDYTTEPENGGLGVFAHEFGHDLGLRDYYDTAGGDNSNGFWTLMDSGSWLGHGDGSTGGSAGHLGATEKLFLGWYGPGRPDGFADLAVVDGLAETPQTVTLGPSHHATTAGNQAVAVTLPDGQGTASGPMSGDYLYSGTRDQAAVQATTRAPITVPAGDPTLRARVAYSTETGRDYAYLRVSTDGGAGWRNVATSVSTGPDHGITGASVGSTWQDITADLSSVAGQEVLLRWEYVTDPKTHGPGLLVDSLSLGSYSTGFASAADWDLTGFHAVAGGSYIYAFPRSYLAENRTFDGYDVTLAQGPYSHDYAISAPGAKVDHYAYEDGLLVWYANGDYSDNNTSEHPGFGANMLVDAAPATVAWSGAGGGAPADGRLQAFDAAFDIDATSALSLTREAVGGSQSVQLPARPSVPVFEDADVDGYWSAQADGWFSTKVAGAGTEIQVVSSDERTGQMALKIGRRFVAALGGASLTGLAAPGGTLSAVPPAWFQQGVTSTVTWLRDGSPIGATGATYAVQGADVGHTISARVTGAKDGYTSTAVVTGGVPATRAGAPTATAAPRITGTARVGRTLRATGARWSIPGASTYTWRVGGTTVGTGTSYELKRADAGDVVTVTETFLATGYAPATATARSGKVAKAKVDLAVKRHRARRGARVKVLVTASSPDLTVPGRVRLAYAGERLRGAKLTRGRATVRLPAHRAGRYRLEVTYPGTTGFRRAEKTVRIKVR